MDNLYVSDKGTHKIYKISSTDKAVSVLAGSSQGFRDGSGSEAQFDTPYDLFVDDHFNVYVSDSGNHQIRKIDRDGHVTSFAGSGVSGNSDGSDNTSRFQDPRGITQDYYGNLYVADFEIVRSN